MTSTTPAAYLAKISCSNYLVILEKDLIASTISYESYEYLEVKISIGMKISMFCHLVS